LEYILEKTAMADPIHLPLQREDSSRFPRRNRKLHLLSEEETKSFRIAVIMIFLILSDS
jgi:hypothetical protein